MIVWFLYPLENTESNLFDGVRQTMTIVDVPFPDFTFVYPRFGSVFVRPGAAQSVGTTFASRDHDSPHHESKHKTRCAHGAWGDGARKERHRRYFRRA